MKYVSTRGGIEPLGFQDAVMMGLATDGGLLLPQSIPRVDADTLRRWLEYLGYEVRQVMNITDVGHLVDDQDEGEDKVEAQAKRTRKTPFEISGEYAQMFLDDIAQFGPHLIAMLTVVLRHRIPYDNSIE